MKCLIRLTGTMFLQILSWYPIADKTSLSPSELFPTNCYKACWYHMQEHQWKWLNTFSNSHRKRLYKVYSACYSVDFIFKPGTSMSSQIDMHRGNAEIKSATPELFTPLRLVKDPREFIGRIRSCSMAWPYSSPEIIRASILKITIPLQGDSIISSNLRAIIVVTNNRTWRSE